MTPEGTVRIDRWLYASRMFKTRTSAQDACRGGHVKLNGVTARPSSAVRAGDEVVAEAPRGKVVWKVLQLAEKRLSAALAKLLYEDHSPPPPPRDEWLPRRAPGAGRPNKHERRALARFRRQGY
jgi:ribosome-associated heat shock protein Hsp15